MSNPCKLVEFNKSSAKVGHFIVKTMNGMVTKYSYEDKTRDNR